MREIKFRVFDTRYNKYIWIVDLSVSRTFWCCPLWDNDDYYLEQFTWIKDKNWKEIYEWDIVEWKQAEWWILESSIDSKVYICKIDWFMNWWACRLNDEHCWFTLWSSHMTVIGNTYENLDLLTN